MIILILAWNLLMLMLEFRFDLCLTEWPHTNLDDVYEVVAKPPLELAMEWHQDCRNGNVMFL
jgi:hypothetical protein